MNQMKLITDSRDEWTVKELLETMHEKVNDLERKLDAMHDYNKARFEAMQSLLQAVVLRITDPGAALYTHVLAMEPTVVPNEDEAMPVLASCTQCDTKAYTEAGIEDFFGWRKMEDGKTIRQSWCRECRSSGKHKTEPVAEPVIVQDEPSPRKRNPLPDDIRVLGQKFRDLYKQADVKAEERVMVLAASKGRETKESVALLVEEQDLRTEARKVQKQYDKDRRPFGNSRKTNGDK